MNRITLTMASLLGGLLSAASVTCASGQTVPSDACSTLADLRILDTNLLSASVVAPSDDLPGYCRVLGYVRPAINFEIRLPISSWNGKFYMAGCGGFCGRIEADQPRFSNSGTYGLKRNYVVSKMDAGHWGDWRDGKWAHHDRQAEIDWGFRSVHETARVTKAVIEAFYGRGAERSYFQGCSTGGRMANMEAWRYPDDFDGIISGTPALDYTGFALLHVWLAQTNVGSDGNNLIASEEVSLLNEAVYDACDSLDGLEDGLIRDPRVCEFDPTSLLCAGDERNNCLTPNQIDAVKKIYAGPKDSAGRQLYPGLPRGSEPYWTLWITGATAEVTDDLLPQLSVEIMRYLAFQEDPGERYNIEDFDFDRDPARLEQMAEIYNADNPDLNAFRNRGGKLLMWHGWADAVNPPAASLTYYERVEGSVGTQEETQDFFRLFMVPGMDHCAILDGPGITDTGFDPLTALERWVEHGEAPASLLATKTDSTGKVVWTRPICPYPQRAVYDGEGEVNESANFECVIP